MDHHCHWPARWPGYDKCRWWGDLGGDGGCDGLRLIENPVSDADYQLLLVDEESNELCQVTLFEESELGGKALRLQTEDGSIETWHYAQTEDNKPRLVPRRATRVPRNFSKEGQVGSPKYIAQGSGAAAHGGSWDDTDPQAEILKLKYMEVDTDGDGMLDVHELAVLLRSGKKEISTSHIRLLFEIVDKAKCGRVSFEDFVDFIFKPETRPKTR